MIKVHMTWPADDVSVDLDDHQFLIFGKPTTINNRVTHTKRGGFGLTVDQAKEFAIKLLDCANQAEILNQQYMEHCMEDEKRQRRKEIYNERSRNEDAKIL